MDSCNALPGENRGNTRLGVVCGGGVCGRMGLSAGCGWDKGAAIDGEGAGFAGAGISRGGSGATGAGAG